MHLSFHTKKKTKQTVHNLPTAYQTEVSKINSLRPACSVIYDNHPVNVTHST